MQSDSEDLANKLRRAKLANNNKKELLSIFFGKPAKDNRAAKEAKKKEFLDVISENEREARLMDLEHVLDLTADQRVNLMNHKEAVVLEKLLPPSRHIDSRTISSIEYQKSKRYVRDMASLFLEADSLMEPNKEYLVMNYPSPILESRLLNTKQHSLKYIEVQKKHRPKDLITVNSPVLERPLKNRYLKALN